MNCLDKKRYKTRVLADRRAEWDFKHYGVRLRVYPCDKCRGFHLSHLSLAEFLARATDSTLRQAVSAYGQEIAADELNAAKEKVRELAPVVAEDKLWLARMRDAAEFHEACAKALRKMLDIHFTSRPTAPVNE